MIEGRRIILTGASEGIGRALALELAARGARLALAARDRDRLESLAQECRSRGGDARALPTDVTSQQDCEWLVNESLAAFGGIDVLIHNAGITMWSRFDALQDLSIFERIMEVNYHAPVRLTSLALPHLKQSKGLIVAVASLAGLTGVPERLGLRRQQARHDRVLRFAAHRARRQRRGRQRDRTRLRGQRNPTSARSDRMANRWANHQW